jgi:dTDP-4-dehydrorhamnose reductase
MIWLIGKQGRLGQELADSLNTKGVEWIGSDKKVDSRDLAALRQFVEESVPLSQTVEWIVNCSAYTAVDKAEEEESLARSINAIGAGNIATIAYELGAKVIHISTDYVFSGCKYKPYNETDIMDPVGAYGRTKAEGELLVAAICQRHFIIRTAWLYGKYGPNFLYTILRLLRSEASISVVCDQVGTPTWAFDLAQAIVKIITSASDKYGIYHFTNEGWASRYTFAIEIQRLGCEFGIIDKVCSINPIKSNQYQSKVVRPSSSMLSKEKIKIRLGLKPPEWKSSLETFMARIPKWSELETQLGLLPNR